ncbi:MULTISPECIES: hypothetical protein [Qipengyuania]|jgi:hypothetical protein|uniref:hypothetical protein n=1 Tax=Qipengyuania TaxID=1855416 RepID=UPI000ADFCCCE|nr:hypothetical protein [Qipengyuania sp. HL-TH1]MCH2497647.1 hypothetical protein [Erythrobacter sp.]WPL57705.1 hypothetical protein SD421_04560 [Qipengyuania sp. HL-TH5]
MSNSANGDPDVPHPLLSGHVNNAQHGYLIAEWLLADTHQSKPVRQEFEQTAH